MRNGATGGSGARLPRDIGFFDDHRFARLGGGRGRRTMPETGPAIGRRTRRALRPLAGRPAYPSALRRDRHHRGQRIDDGGGIIPPSSLSGLPQRIFGPRRAQIPPITKALRVIFHRMPQRSEAAASGLCDRNCSRDANSPYRRLACCRGYVLAGASQGADAKRGA